MRRGAALLVMGTLFATALVATPVPLAAGGPVIKPEPPSLKDTIDLALADIQSYWTKNMKRAYKGVRYEPVEKLTAYDSTNYAQVASCGAHVPEAYQENAFYCPAEEKIVWDIEGWFPHLYEDISYLAVVAILAHEWGHAIQHQGGLPADSPSILVEQQADCFAGTYLRFLSDGKSSRFPKINTEDLDTMVSAALDISDAVGTSTTTPGAHGSPFDRINALQEGFEQGPGRCARYDTDAPKTLDLVFTDPEDQSTGGNLDLETITADVQKDLDDFWSTALTKYAPVALVVPYDVDTVERLPQCGDAEEPRESFRNVIFYCADGNFVAWDEALVSDAHSYYGDFAVATLLANQWSRHVQDLLGVDYSAKGADDHSTCLTGAYIGNLYRKSRPTALLRLSPGDLDEAIQVQLDYFPVGKKAAPFTKVAALRRGFFQGADSCDTLLPKKAKKARG